MTEEHSELVIDLLADPDAEDEELAELVRQLRRELLDLDVEVVVLATPGQPPVAAKGIGLAADSTLMVRFALGPDVLRSVVSGVQSWADRQRLYSVNLILDGDSLWITGPRRPAQGRAVDLWIARHASSE
jgi:hypothetical protein